MKDASAPGSLELVRAFVNSIDLEHPETTDAFASVGAARVWLTDAGIDPSGMSDADLAGLRTLREELRAEMLAHGDGGERQKPAALTPIRLDAERTEDGDFRLTPRECGAQGLRAGLAAAIWEAQIRGTWSRLKACRQATCRFAYYDKTKNGSGAWCAMETCGNRAKAERRRARERGRAT